MASPTALGYKQLQLDLWSLLSGADSSPYADVVFRAVDPNQKPADASSGSGGQDRPAAQSFHAHKVIIYHTAPMLFASLLSVEDHTASADNAAAPPPPATATIEIEPHIFKLCLEFLYTGAVTTPGVTREDKVRLLSFAEHYNIPGLMTAKAWKESSDSCWILPEPHQDSVTDKNPPPPKPILAARHSPLFADVTLLVDGQRFHAHKAILAARSAYFARMFGSGLAESFQSEIAITQASAASFGLFLDYLYSATLRDWSLLTPDAAVELVPVCHQYGATSLVNPLQSAGPSDLHLKAICEQLLSDVLDGDNVCLIYDIALFHNATGLAQRCGEYIRRNLEEVSHSDNFVYLSDAGVVAAEKEVQRIWQAAQSPAMVAREAERRLAILAATQTRQRRIAHTKTHKKTNTNTTATTNDEAEAEAEQEDDDGEHGVDAQMSLDKAEKLWRSLFWAAMVDLVAMGCADPSTTVPLRSRALLDYLAKKGETFEVVEFERKYPHHRDAGLADALWKTSSADLAQILNVAPQQVLKEVVFFKFTAPKGRHAYKNGAYELVLVLVNGDRQVDEHRLKQILFGDEYQESDGSRSLVALASHEAIFHRTGFTALYFPSFYHRKPLMTIVDSALVGSAEQDPVFYANCGALQCDSIKTGKKSPSVISQDRALKVHLDTLMRLLPADRVTITPVSRAFPSPTPDQPKARGGGRKQG